jgi:putative ABC transport system permease protein
MMRILAGGISGKASVAIRLAWRDLQGGFKGFQIFIACLALGVASIVAIGSTARSVSESLMREGRTILGGDISLSLIHRELAPAERSWLTSKGRVSSVAVMRAMARANDDQTTLVEVKAVDESYPILGRLKTEPTAKLSALTAKSEGVFGLLAEEALAARLDIKVGDRLRIGDGEFALRALIVGEPDKLAGGVGLGPRVIISQLALRETGLLQPGSLTRWLYRLIVETETSRKEASDDVIEALVEEAETRFPDSGWQVRSRANASPQFTRNLERFSLFLTLVGLTALSIGGIGVANAIRGFVERKATDFATLKSIGATGAYVFVVSLIEVLLATSIGVVIGVGLGSAAPFALAFFSGSSLPIPFTPGFFIGEAASGASSIASASLFFVILFSASNKKSALIYVLSILAVFIVLRSLGGLVVWIARSMPKPSALLARLALANLHRPSAITVPLIMSLGLGLTVLVALMVVDTNIRGQIRGEVATKAPSFFFIDIPSQEASSFETFIEKLAPDAIVERVPMMRGRFVQLNETPADKIPAKENAAWILEGDRGITYSNKPPQHSRIIAGDWWPADYTGTPLVSLDAEIADGLGAKIGDDIVLNVMGRNITARIANLRKVEWRSFGINFVFVFSPNTFAGAPHMHLATATLPQKDRAIELVIVKEVAKAYPHVVSVRVQDTLDAITSIAEQLAFAIRGITGVTLVAALLVLGGAIAASQRSRILDAVILKTLGTTRFRLLTVYLIEFTALGLIASLFALVFGGFAAWAILTRIMRIDTIAWPAETMVLTVIGTLAVTLLLGLGATWRILGQKPSRHLRYL